MTMPSAAAPERLFDEQLREALKAHAGQWVAILDDQVVATGDSPAEVLKRAAKAGHKQVLLHRVPDEGTAYFF